LRLTYIGGPTTRGLYVNGVEKIYSRNFAENSFDLSKNKIVEPKYEFNRTVRTGRTVIEQASMPKQCNSIRRRKPDLTLTTYLLKEMLVMIEFSHFSAVNNNIIAYSAQINIQI